jgi:hypothetical protein
MAITLIHKKSSVPGAVPTAAQLSVGELAVNLADKKWFTKTTAGSVVCLNQIVLLDGGEILSSATALRIQTHSGDNLVTHTGGYIAAEQN